MECFPPCKTCTGKCKVEVKPRREAPTTYTRRSNRKPKNGSMTLVCGHPIDLRNDTLTILGSKLGAMPWCDWCRDHKQVAPPKRKKKTKASDNDVPLF